MILARVSVRRLMALMPRVIGFRLFQPSSAQFCQRRTSPFLLSFGRITAAVSTVLSSPDSSCPAELLPLLTLWFSLIAHGLAQLTTGATDQTSFWVYCRWQPFLLLIFLFPIGRLLVALFGLRAIFLDFLHLYFSGDFASCLSAAFLVSHQCLGNRSWPSQGHSTALWLVD